MSTTPDPRSVLHPPKLIQYKSTAIHKIGYDSINKDLYVIFTGNHQVVYIYNNIPQHIVDKLISSKSVGSYFMKFIKPKFLNPIRTPFLDLYPAKDKITTTTTERFINIIKSWAESLDKEEKQTLFLVIKELNQIKQSQAEAFNQFNLARKEIDKWKEIENSTMETLIKISKKFGFKE